MLRLILCLLLFPDEIDYERRVESEIWIVDVSTRIGQHTGPANLIVLKMVNVPVNPKQWRMRLDKLVKVRSIRAANGLFRAPFRQ